MDHVVSLYKDWKTKLMDILCIVALNMTFGTWNVSIVFVNIL